MTDFLQKARADEIVSPRDILVAAVTAAIMCAATVLTAAVMSFAVLSFVVIASDVGIITEIV